MALPTPTSDTLTIRDLKCHVHQWNIGTETPKALAVVFHGFLAHGGYPTVRYAAEAFAEEGYAVIAVDFPGHGKSEGIRGYVPSSTTLVSDGVAMVQYAHSLYASAATPPPMMLVGSSMGGAIALSVAHQLQSTDIAIRGVVLLAPMLKLNVSAIEHGALQCLSYIVPTLPLIPSSATDDDKQYRDATKRKECADDTLTVSGAHLRVASALACVDLTTSVQQDVMESIQCPFLLMIADEDVVVKNEGSEDLFAKAPSTDKTKKHYPALHGLLCEPSPLFDEIKKDMLQWIKEHV